ncbi:MAG TPA: autotransporter domain-containing protein [Sphingomonadaceae bacterium]|uniref:autotransporter domain-containing protein n=1 Tax=Pararhizobium sp. TaxID=1977563 RepID=UPI002B553CAF|nr:autotransporter domain-containing protein [Pararhizobium sp.]HTN14477.1 autotransporter domain-containing protein [Sphingomonadaceae bacterium]HTO32600.1 autotransporter domain-containing protein [Pararhizobium sp.]
MSKVNPNRRMRRTLALGASILALGASDTALAQSLCGNGSPEPVCPIVNSGTSGPIAGTTGTATIVTNSGTITGTPAISQGGSTLLSVTNQTGGLIDGDGGTAIQGSQQLGFIVSNAGTIDGDVIFTDGPAQPSIFSGNLVRYISDGGTLNGNLQLGSANGYTTAVFVQRGADDGVTGTISAGAGIDVYAKSYASDQTVELGDYVLPASFEVEGYEVLGDDTTVILTGSGSTIALMGDGNVVNEGTIDPLDTTGLYPPGVTVNPAAVFYVSPQLQLYRRNQIPLGQPNSFYAQTYGSALHSFTNEGTINGDVTLAAASFVNNGQIYLASNSAGTAIFTSADEDFLFRNTGSITMGDAGARPANAAMTGEFFDGLDAAVRLQSAIDTSQPAKVTVENSDGALIAGGIAFTGVASDFTFDNAGTIAIGENPFELDRAVTVELGGFAAAIDPAMREDVVSDSVSIGNSGIIEGGIEVESQTRAFTFTNTGEISRDPNDPYAAAVELAAYDWADTPGGTDTHNGDTFSFNNSGMISGTVAVDAEASLVSVVNSDTIEAEARPGYTVISEAEDAFFLSQETILDSTLTFENSGTISNADYAGGAVTFDIEAGNIDSGVAGADSADASVSIVNSGSIISSGGSYITTPPNLGLQPNQIGLAFSTGLIVNVDAEGSGAVSITNEAGALIDARGAPHIGTPGGPQPVANPAPNAGGVAIVVVADSATIVNDGTIRGAPGNTLVTPEGTTVIPLGAEGADFEGVFGGGIDTFNSVDQVTNGATGVIEGGIALRQGDDSLTNNGAITGNIWTGTGADTFIQSGTVTGNIDMGDGKDWLQVTGHVDGDITMGGGNVDILVTPLAGAGTRFGGTVDGGAGAGDNLIFAVNDGGSLEEAFAVSVSGFEYIALGGTGTITSDGTAHDAVQLATGTITLAGGSTFNASGDYAFLGDAPLAQNLTNEGTVNGSIALGAMDDTFANYGTLNGNLELGDGNDTFIEGVDAVFTGTADGGAGNDTFVLDLGNGGGPLTTNIYDQLVNFEVLTTTGTGSVIVEGTDGGDEFNNQGTFEGNIGLGGGDDNFNQTGTVNGDVDLGEGDDAINNTGTVNGTVDLGTGNNAFVNAPSATINGNVQASTGDDQIDNQGTVNGNVDLGDGNNQFANTPTATINGDVASGTGDDQVDNQGTINGDIYLDGNQQQPADLFALRTTAAVNPTGGDDEMSNDGTIDGSIFAAGGNDTLENTGTVTGDIDLGEGDDELLLSGNWSIGGTATGGEGSDLLGLTFAEGSSGEAPQVLDLAGFEDFEQLEIAGGTGKIDGTANFGAIDILSGRLIGAAESMITGDVTVHSGGTFGSAGTVAGDIVVASGGTLSPGASPAIMNVVGDVSLASGSITTFEFVPAPGQSDQLLIDGDLAISSGAVLNLVGERPLTPGVAYDLIVADEITGTFTIGTWDKSAIQGFLAYRDGVDGDRLQLLGTFVANGTVSPQAGAAIDYVNEVLIAGDASAALLDAVPDLLDGDGYASASAFALIGPEAYASAGQLGTERGLSLGKSFRAGAGAPHGADARPFTFANGFGDWRTLKADGSTGVSRARNETYGVLGGIGFGNERASVAGFVGYLDSEQKIASLGARTDADGLSAGITGHVSAGGFQLSALVAYDWGKADTLRAVPGNATVSSDYRLRSLVLDASAGYDFSLSSDWALRPEVGLTHISTKRGDAQESGSDAFSLDVDAARHKATFIDGGIRLLGGQRDEATFHPWAQLGVREQLEGDVSWASAGFAGTASGFLVPGATRKDTVITAGAGFDFDLSPSARLFAGYQGEFGGGTGSIVTVGVSFGF